MSISDEGLEGYLRLGRKDEFEVVFEHEGHPHRVVHEHIGLAREHAAYVTSLHKVPAFVVQVTTMRKAV